MKYSLLYEALSVKDEGTIDVVVNTWYRFMIGFVQISYIRFDATDVLHPVRAQDCLHLEKEAMSG
jgi:hypothetical protein